MSIKQSNEEDNIREWIDSLNDRDSNKNSKKISFFQTLYEDITFEVGYWWDNSIVIPIRSFFKGIDNLWKWRKIIWTDRWWDYSYFLIMLRFKLKDMEEHWGRDTHYVKDYTEKKHLQDLLEDLDWMLDNEHEFEDGHEEEYKKRSRRFFSRLDRHHRKFWD
jgi:hypothetical protein